MWEPDYSAVDNATLKEMLIHALAVSGASTINGTINRDRRLWAKKLTDINAEIKRRKEAFTW